MEHEDWACEMDIPLSWIVASSPLPHDLAYYTIGSVVSVVRDLYNWILESWWMQKLNQRLGDVVECDEHLEQLERKRWELEKEQQAVL